MTIEKFRSTYEKTKLIHYNDPHTQDSGPDNPLSLDDDVSTYLFLFFWLYLYFKLDFRNYLCKLIILEYLETVFQRYGTEENYSTRCDSNISWS